MAKVYAYQGDTLSGACGVGYVEGFSYDQGFSWHYRLPIYEAASPSGTGAGANWLTAGFIGTEVCKDAYHVLKKKYKIVFQTPIRENKNSNNDFIFCVFDTKRCKKSVREEHNNQFNWPFEE